MNIFDCAIKIEEEARSCYRKLIAESSDPELRHLFSLLAAAEEEHRNNLIRMKTSADPNRTQLDGLHESACAYKPLQSERELRNRMRNDPDFYMNVVREGEDDIRFYEDLAAREEDEAMRANLLMLAEEERKHLKVIENIYNFVEEPRTFLAWGEFSNLKEM